MKMGSTKAALSEMRRQLVELMQSINFGRIENLTIRDGDPVLEPLPRIVREVKFGGDNGPRPERDVRNFLLKTQVVELFQSLDQIDNGVLVVLEIKHGLPFRMLLVESVA